MKNLWLLAILLLCSCNFISSKVDMSEYMFSDKERTWTLKHPSMQELDETFHHKPYSEGEKRFVEVTTIKDGKKTIITYQIKEETIEVVKHYKDGWGYKQTIMDKPWPRYVYVDEQIMQKDHADQKLDRMNDSAIIGDKRINHEVIEVLASSSLGEDVHTYAKGVGLINTKSKFTVPSATGETISGIEINIVLNEVDWIKCKVNVCEVSK